MRFTSRAVVFTGGLFLSFGFITSMFATRLFHLFFTYGFMLGNMPPFPKNIEICEISRTYDNSFVKSSFCRLLLDFENIKYLIYILNIK